MALQYETADVGGQPRAWRLRPELAVNPTPLRTPVENSTPFGPPTIKALGSIVNRSMSVRPKHLVCQRL